MAKNRSDSQHIMTDIAKSAAVKIMPPESCPLEKEEMPFWDSIIAARVNWTNIDLMHAANLARCMHSIEKNTKLLRIEGDVLENARGTQIMNPRFTVLEQLTRRSVALSGKLQIHAQATIGKPETNRKKNAVKNELSNALDAFDDDDLIARPN